MVDAHIHIEFQDYSQETIQKMVAEAQKHNIATIRIVDHTHKFIEFKPIYQPVNGNTISKAWYEKKKPMPIAAYLSFIEDTKKHHYPIAIEFGLEVCYFKETESILRQLLAQFKMDFVIGSVHFIDGIGFDIAKEAWIGYDVDTMYRRYYDIMEDLIRSEIFDSLGHPDSIKLYRHYPTFSLIPTYERLADLLLAFQLKTENNSGLSRYRFDYPGLNKDLLAVFKQKGVTVEKASDAHIYSNIGKDFDRIETVN